MKLYRNWENFKTKCALLIKRKRKEAFPLELLNKIGMHISEGNIYPTNFLLTRQLSHRSSSTSWDWEYIVRLISVGLLVAACMTVFVPTSKSHESNPFIFNMLNLWLHLFQSLMIVYELSFLKSKKKGLTYKIC
jgi:hypothetical protein